LERYFYIYNVKQANYFVQNNIKPLEVGKGKSKAVYLKFLRDEQASKIFDAWCKLCAK
jgi:hypothetical protein